MSEELGTSIEFVQVRLKVKDDGRLMGVVVLDRIVPGVTPDYCIHGRTVCILCQQAVWLGNNTLKQVRAGYGPVCLTCARSGILGRATPAGNVADNKRENGPHE
jgi:hypothetical protein